MTRSKRSTRKQKRRSGKKHKNSTSSSSGSSNSATSSNPGWGRVLDLRWPDPEPQPPEWEYEVGYDGSIVWYDPEYPREEQTWDHNAHLETLRDRIGSWRSGQQLEQELDYVERPGDVWTERGRRNRRGLRWTRTPSQSPDYRLARGEITGAWCWKVVQESKEGPSDRTNSQFLDTLNEYRHWDNDDN